MLFEKDVSLTKRQTEELAKYCMDLSKLSLGSWVFGFFTPQIALPQILFGILGLTFAVVFFTLGMRLFKEVT